MRHDQLFTSLVVLVILPVSGRDEMRVDLSMRQYIYTWWRMLVHRQRHVEIVRAEVILPSEAPMS